MIFVFLFFLAGTAPLTSFGQDLDEPAAAETVEGENNSSESSEEADGEAAEDSASNEEAGAATEEAKAEPTGPTPIEVQWFRPTLQPGSKKNRKLVKLSGKVNKVARVYVGKKSIPTIVKKRVRKFPTKRAFKGANNPTKKGYGTTTDEYGFFELELELPSYPVQLPLKIYGQDKTRSNVVLKLYVDKDEQDVIDRDKVTPRLRRDKTLGLWLGVGANYLQYSQDTDISELEYSSFAAPSFFVKGEYTFNRQWALSIEASHTPGTAENDDNNAFVSLDEDYSWTIIDVNAHYFPRSWEQKKFLFGKYADYGLRFGFQHQLVPFIETAGTVGSLNAITIEQKGITYLTGGGFFKAYDNSNWVYELFMRLQIPVAGPSEFTVKPSFGFDGSVGAYYLYNANLRFGMFWYGQYQSLDFEGLEEEYFPPDEISGNQGLLFSNIEFRVGYEF